RSHDDVVELEQWPGVRLRREDVECGTTELSLPKSIDECVLVDQLAARRIDDARAVAHLRKGFDADRSARLRRQREMEREELGRCIHVFRPFETLCAELAESLRRDERVVCHDAHAEPCSTARDLLADATEAEHPERLVRELHPPVRLPF